MNINQYLQEHKSFREYEDDWRFRENAPRVECTDGFSMSVQVSDGHYCHPRVNDAPFYWQVEVGYPSSKEDLLIEFIDGDKDDPTETVFGYVPVEIVDRIIEKHGGLKG